MIILGIDTAIRTTGYGVIEMTSMQQIRALDCGIIKNKASDRHSECMRRIAGGIRTLIETYHPDQISIEDAFYQKNVKTAMVLSLARGAAITTAAQLQVPVFAYAPTKIKKAVFGNGSATKEQMAVILAAMFKIKIDHIPLDATDALAMALCHGQILHSPLAQKLLPQQV